MPAPEGQFNDVGETVNFLRAQSARLYEAASCGDTGGQGGITMQTVRAMLRRAREGLCAAAKRLRPALGAFWNRFGYAASMAALLLLVAVAAHAYRNRAAVARVPAPTATAEPALLSSAVVEGEEEEEAVVYQAPLQGEIVGEYRPDAMIWSDTLGMWQTHEGVDIAAPLGTAVCASADGVVAQAYRDPLLGHAVRIEHADGCASVYACLQSVEMVEVGQTVRMGEVVGAVGESADSETALGPHLHFAFYRDGKAVPPPLAQA